jgi:hypothetical protein
MLTYLDVCSRIAQVAVIGAPTPHSHSAALGVPPPPPSMSHAGAAGSGGALSAASPALSGGGGAMAGGGGDSDAALGDPATLQGLVNMIGRMQGQQGQMHS